MEMQNDLYKLSATKVSQNDFERAQSILDQRSTTNSAYILPKGGIKYSENHETDEEQTRLHNYYNAVETVVSTWKVRKLANLGLAEWLPDLFVAKITKQGKFMQTKGFPHHDGFFALFPEEALFLLDLGDIELTYKNALLSMQDAFSLLLSQTPGGALCTLDEYNVYAHLSRMGYRVQRFSTSEKSDEDLEEERVSCSKREIQNEDHPAKEKLKKLKLLNDNNTLLQPTKNETEFDENSMINEDINLQHAEEPSHRGWWLDNSHKEVSSQEIMNGLCMRSENIQASSFTSNRITFPNLATEGKETSILMHGSDLVPAMTSSDLFEVAAIWHQRLNKDDRSGNSQQRKEYSYCKEVDIDQACRNALSWSHYKNLIALSTEKFKLKMSGLYDEMHSGKIRPLINPNSAHSKKDVLEKLKIFEEDSAFYDENVSSIFSIRFNVYQTDRTKAFRKTQPGKPFLRIIVVNSSNPIPTPRDINDYNFQSDKVPVKLAFVDSGQIMFFAFDKICIPTDVF